MLVNVNFCNELILSVPEFFFFRNVLYLRKAVSNIINLFG